MPASQNIPAGSLVGSAFSKEKENQSSLKKKKKTPVVMVNLKSKKPKRKAIDASAVEVLHQAKRTFGTERTGLSRNVHGPMGGTPKALTSMKQGSIVTPKIKAMASSYKTVVSAEVRKQLSFSPLKQVLQHANEPFRNTTELTLNVQPTKTLTPRSTSSMAKSVKSNARAKRPKAQRSLLSDRCTRLE